MASPQEHLSPAGLEHVVEDREAQLQQDEDARWEQYREGAVIEGASDLYKTTIDLFDDKDLDKVAGVESENGWSYWGKGVHESYLLFRRNAGKGPFEAYTELLQVAHINGEHLHVMYHQIPEDLEVEESKAGRTTKGDTEHYSFDLYEDGRVGHQMHARGPVTQGPDIIVNGVNQYRPNSYFHIRTNLIEPVSDRSVSPDARMDEGDISKLNDKFTEISAGIKEVETKQTAKV